MRPDRLTVTVLGSGTSTGVPVAGCRCAVCSSDDPRNRRTRCSVLIQLGGRNILIDTATDLRQQALREGIEHIDAVLITHTHADHVHGIDDLRAFTPPGTEPIPVYAAPDALTSLRRVFAYIFSEPQGASYRPRLSLQPLADPLPLGGLVIEPIPLQHGPDRATGYRIGPFAYLTDCNALPPESLARLTGLEVLVIDGLRFKPHATHFNIPQAAAVARQLGAGRTYLTHLSHEVDHARHQAGLPEGVELAYDGLRLEFDWPQAE